MGGWRWKLCTYCSNENKETDDSIKRLIYHRKGTPQKSEPIMRSDDERRSKHKEAKGGVMEKGMNDNEFKGDKAQRE